VVLPVTFGETRDNYHTEYVKFEVADFETSYHAILKTTGLVTLGGYDYSLRLPALVQCTHLLQC
jgi:hypothetical protein